jgi:tRNA(Arg) A34 adenosine deaminase TadA
MRAHGEKRRTLLARALCFGLAWQAGGGRAQPAPPHPDRRWYEAAAAMQRLAESWGDQSYGAVLVLGGRLAGEGPSRVVKNQDSSAHAEREAIRDAQRRLGRQDLAGAVLYSTSRPCPLCEAAAAQARVGRMYFGAGLNDAGVPHER